MPPSPPDSPPVRPRLLVCDLDGTLLHSDGVITDTTLAALRAAGVAGIEIAIATGRRHSFAWKVLAPLGLDPEMVLVSSNGAITRTMAGDAMHRISMPLATTRSLCTQLDGFRTSLIFTFDRTGPGSLVVEDIAALHRRIPRWVESNAHEIACCTPLERAFETGEEPIQAMICGTLREMEDGMIALSSAAPETALLRERLSIHRTEYAARDLCIVDLMPAGCSKGTAIARLAAQRGIRAAEVAAIGDNMNDADMLAFAGRAIVMRNAAAELHTIAARNGWTVTGSNDEDGAAQAILRMLEETPQTADDAAMASTGLID
jgi:hydroxymethylpyrimidine pyrophosphatase-like HAD family hydrolase